MARPRNDELRQTILDAAFAQFLTKGYANTRLRDIAEACGISMSLLQYYYPKRVNLVVDIFYDLILQTFEFIARELLSGFEARLGRDADFANMVMFYRIYYGILHANNDRLLRLYSVVLFDATLLKSSTDLALTHESPAASTTVMPQQSRRTRLGAYAINGMLAQFVAIYFDSAPGEDLEKLLDEAIHGYFSFTDVEPDRIQAVFACVDEALADPRVEAFARAYLEGLPK